MVELTPRFPYTASAPPSFVYFARRQDGLIKIGRSIEVKQRLRNLACGAGPLELLCQEPGGIFREEELHARFAADRRQGEWFEESPALREYIDSMKPVEADPADVEATAARCTRVIDPSRCEDCKHTLYTRSGESLCLAPRCRCDAHGHLHDRKVKTGG